MRDYSNISDEELKKLCLVDADKEYITNVIKESKNQIKEGKYKVIVSVADADEKSARVVVPDYQLSLAIGREGQNARLAARLTGYKIDIKSETQARESGEFFDYDSYDGEPEDEEYFEDEDGESFGEETDENN